MSEIIRKDEDDNPSNPAIIFNMLQIEPDQADTLQKLNEMSPGFAAKYLDEFIADSKHFREMETAESTRQEKIINIIDNDQKQSLIATYGGIGLAGLSIVGTIYLGSIGQTNEAIALITATAGVILAIRGFSTFTSSK